MKQVRYYLLEISVRIFLPMLSAFYTQLKFYKVR